MTTKESQITDHLTNHDSPIMTSDTSNELKERIKYISQQVLKRNYELYKALENK